MRILVICALLVLLQTSFGQQVEFVTPVPSEDLGAYKWAFSGTAQEGDVVVFRVTTIREWPNGKVSTTHHDTVHYGPGEKQTASAYFVGSHYIDAKKGDPTWHWQALGGSGQIEGHYDGHSCGGDTGMIRFRSEKWGRTQKIFHTRIISYKEAIESYQDLPSISQGSGWSWAGSPLTRSGNARAE